MRNWMSTAIGAVANSTVVLPIPLLSNRKTIPRTSPYLISILTPTRRFLSASSRPSSFTAHHNFSDYGYGEDGHCVATSRKGSKKWVQSHGYRPGQAMMLWKRMYGNNIWAHHIDELEGLNKDFKKMLSENAEFKALALKEIHTASDGTRKILFTLDDGLIIETVVIPCDRGRTTVMGLKRHLTAAEIVEQAVFARRLLTSDFGSITNVVFMGMGEPLHNVDNVIKAADIMVDEQGLHFSPRKVTVSTSGLVPQLRRFLHESNCALAVSLNATTDE
ncbi:Aldolase-type TIM barrel, partial [Sesbania bispinosa]